MKIDLMLFYKILLALLISINFWICSLVLHQDGMIALATISALAGLGGYVYGKEKKKKEKEG